jgi:parallel beta-helix repeat protein
MKNQTTRDIRTMRRGITTFIGLFAAFSSTKTIAQTNTNTTKVEKQSTYTSKTQVVIQPAADRNTDSTSLIQTALDSGAAIILLEKGEFSVSSLRIPSNTTLIGSGNSTTILSVRPQTNDSCIRSNPGTEPCRNIKIANIKIIGNSAQQTDKNNSWGIRLDNAINFTIDSVIVFDTASWGIGCMEGENGIIRDCSVSGVKNKQHSGFLFGASATQERFCNHIDISGCTSSNNGQDGFTLERGSDIRVSHCRATGNGQTGFKVSGTNSTIVSSCFAEANTNGFKTQNKNQFTIFANNISYRNNDSGYFFGNVSDTKSHALVVTGNQAIENGQQPSATSYGFAFESHDNSYYEDIVFSGNMAIDYQSRTTQLRGISFGASGAFSNVALHGNLVRGNKVSIVYGRSAPQEVGPQSTKDILLDGNR